MTRKELQVEMPFYELIYETGAHSVAFYDTDDEAMNAAGAHNDRAKSGGRSLSSDVSSPPAERVARILKYDRHPGDYGFNQTMSTEVFNSEFANAVEASTVDGVVDLNEVQAAVRDLSSPLATKEAPHDSNFRMQDTAELALPWVEGGAS